MSVLQASESILAENVLSCLASLLATTGYHRVAGPLFASAACDTIAADIRVVPEKLIRRGPSGEVAAVGLLATSDSALALLDASALGVLVDQIAGEDAVLSRADGIVAGAPAWRRSFTAPMRDLPARALRPGMTCWIALAPGVSRMELLRSSQHLPLDASPDDVLLPVDSVAVAQGEVLLLEGGVIHRPAVPGSVWLTLEFVRPWLKPRVLFVSALGARMQRLSARGRRYCGETVLLPVSVEEFLAIEEAALTSPVGQAKGSGI